MDLPWYIPLLIFFARICDVSIGTIRLIFVIGGWRWRSAVLGFIEVTIWAMAAGWMIRYVTHPLALISFAGGFAAGTVVGMTIEQKLAYGVRLVRVINQDLTQNVSATLRDKGYRVTRVEGMGRSGPVEIAFAVVPRRSLTQLMGEIERASSQAVVTVERADYASAASLSYNDATVRSRVFGWTNLVRK